VLVAAGVVLLMLLELEVIPRGVKLARVWR